ncbi:RsmB/NOP family class I SAM-dependent RNA methyltransferase [Salipiger sp. IMCC34102]|uniref:RsmB/NOP family class I SAM-dependent RNA methyltransferase n=1 Tax=Salipiger sp. IMCC34102 TaxID=2510647 RepID=UPI00101BA717|nr:RsmB/NOP family class I SAM-dependent RNA methyltransferase [Salipiger sp. IMCC34102]RYH03543.1 RsmB/NOP family class I SAM-dependent RNA methyltransferase [Salipiger sp. IMCC34102]
MTPAARYAAAIDVLDAIFAGAPAERVLTGWARANRYAGSKDRAAVRDHVYDVLRARRTLAATGGGADGRAAILGLLRRDGPPPEAVFGAGGYAPSALTPEERASGTVPDNPAEAADLPDWLWPAWQESLGDRAAEIAALMRERAPITLRVALRNGSRAKAQAALAADGIETEALDAVETALRVTANPRRVATSTAYREGLVELQDAASQQAMVRLAPFAGPRVLDYCAGGGGKSLALADLLGQPIQAHDADADRMADLPARAARAGVQIERLATADLPGAAPFDLVLCDAPCSGSGTWRRTPDAKWRQTSERLAELRTVQGDILDAAATLVRPGGNLAYATCSVLKDENDGTVADFLARHHDMAEIARFVLTPGPTQDGFFMVVFRRG